MIRSCLRVGCVCLALLLSSSTACAQKEAPKQANKPEMILKVYRVSDLFTPRPDYPYHEGLPTTGTIHSSSNTGFSAGFSAGGGMGGIGGSGTAQGGGGGFFQIPDPVPRVAQLGSGAGGFGMDSGMGGMGAGSETGPGIDDSLRFNRNELRDAIVYAIQSESWEDNGGDAVITSLGGLFLIKQTTEAHQQIEQLLNDIRTEGGGLHTVTLDATWLSLTTEEFEKLAPKENEAGGELTPIDPAILKELSAKNPGHQGRVSCYNDQTVHIVSGHRRNVVVNTTPTVGYGAVGYSPTIAIPNIGVLLQVRPTVDPNRQSAVLNLTSTLTEWEDSGEGITIKTDFEGGTKEGMTTPGGTAQITVDRVNLKTQHLGTTVRVPVGQPVLVGGMSQINTDGKAPAEAPARQLYLIVKLSVNAAANR